MSRDLDKKIFEIVHGRKPNISTFEQYEPSEHVPKYTTSIDEALAALGVRRETIAEIATAICGSILKDKK